MAARGAPQVAAHLVGCVVGCLAGGAVAAVVAGLMVVRMLGVPHGALPHNEAPGQFVFAGGGEPSIGSGSGRILALDMSSGQIREVSSDLVAMSPDGRWVLLRDGSCRGPRGELVRRVEKEGVTAPDRTGSIGRPVLGNSGVLVVLGTTSVKVVDLRRGTAGTLHPQRSVRYCAITPDGTHAYVSGYSTPGPIELLDLASGVVEPVGRGGSPAVSPSGVLAYVSGFRGRRIRLLRPDGRRTEIAGPGVWLERLSWSPDGRFLAYSFPTFPESGLIGFFPCALSVGIVSIETGRHYRTVTTQCGVGSQGQVYVSTGTWVGTIPSWLIRVGR
jgi:hypothetical protein